MRPSSGSPASSWHPWVLNGARVLPIQEDETALVVWALWLGLAVFFGPSSGYLYGWVFGAAVIGWLVQQRLPAYPLWWGALANVLGGIGRNIASMGNDGLAKLSITGTGLKQLSAPGVSLDGEGLAISAGGVANVVLGDLLDSADIANAPMNAMSARSD